jgi:ParB family transcriptional regulator, chromosome partitioning protein
LAFSLTAEGQFTGQIESLFMDDISIPHEGLRDCYDDDTIREIADSIKTNGLVHPILVREVEDHFEVVAGCRRYYACKSLGWKKIPCSIVYLNDVQTFEMSLIENIQRSSLSPLEEANAFKKYICDKEWGSITKLAVKIGKSPSYITKRISLLKLPEDIQKKLMESSLSPSTAEELFPLGDSAKQSKVATIIVERNLPLRRVREIVKDELRDRQKLKETVLNNDIQKIDKANHILTNAIDKIMYLAIEDGNESDPDNAMVRQNNLIVRELLLNTYRMLNVQIENHAKVKRKMQKASWARNTAIQTL